MPLVGGKGAGGAIPQIRLRHEVEDLTEAHQPEL